MKQKNMDELDFIIKVTARILLTLFYFALIGTILILTQ